jgi:tetratricopeptide (TPR) repeat protein
MFRKAGKIFFFFFLGVLFLEIFLRVGGVIYNEYQNIGQAKADSENTFKVLTLGESTTAGANNWPHKAQNILNDKFDNIDFVFINKAINSTESGVLLSKVKGQIEEYEPDAVISMMGINDGDFSTYFSNFKYKGEVDEPFLEALFEFLEQNVRVYKFIKLVQDPASFNEDSKGSVSRSDKKAYYKNKSHYLNNFAPEGDREKGIEKCKQILSDDPENKKVWSILGWLTYTDQTDREKVVESRGYFEKALEIDPAYINAYYGLIALDLYGGDVEKSISIAEQALEYYPDNDFFYSFLLKKLSEPNNRNSDPKQVIGKELNKNFVYSEEDPQDVTAYHYNKLYEILKENDIPLIAMQYPTKDVQELKNYFSEERQEDIIFISNEENFEKALQENEYEDIFTDRCYEDFGHATEKGRMITAENVASTIEEEFDLE